ncbi:hypothetical protein Kpol_359p8 [Vanderwaltozyma polyspora DSM 70294]|uniref:Peptidase S54 rhomboid domain-containing protein n=1 Tax=Vanderwaltozyma polyspora (strain ATCC 22028 / DSM 70294 / BCRC 21397 / CBS 2163 / NBRC 10782 / NRRL Y-8283 / UCD 57-17) TaxID=436907 RepID=A7TSB0_VANPO|nr:uncharacterized protein Kpol_359p8 [Vanderwaltozyma polyspora DSM 70294]EDO14847.1 hypothetical protein Kpol_359p8 [Vanderwaltozyma polyspora DSM 70294]
MFYNKWFTIGGASPSKLLSSKSSFFTRNSTQLQRTALKGQFFGANLKIKNTCINQRNAIAQINNVRSFSTTSLIRSRFNPMSGENSSNRYVRLNRFQQYRQNDRGTNSLRNLTIFGASLMVGIYFGSPYLFEYVPPFNHFKRNPSHLVYTILGLNVVVFGLWQLPKNWRFLQRYMLLEKSNIYSKWSLIGSAFSHQEGWHLAMNMLALWSFGTSLCSMLGASNFFSLYMNSALGASLFSLWYPKIARLMMMGPSLGASGALFGIFGCFSYLFPQAKILLFVFPIPGGAWVAFLAAMAWNAAGCALRWGTFDYAAHLGGSMIGVAYGWYISQVTRKNRERRMEKMSRWI